MPRDRAVVAMCILAIVGLIALVGGSAVALDGGDDDEFDPDELVLDVAIGADGTANWTIEHRYRLADDAEEEAFDELATDIADDEEAYLDRFLERMGSTVETAETETNRDMSISDARVETERRTLPQSYGIVRYEFTWHGFAYSEGDRLRAGDAVGGLFLDENTNLRFRWDDDWSVDAVSPTPDEERDNAVTWRGPVDFATDEPRVSLVRSDAMTEGLFSIGQLAMLAGVLAIALLGGGVMFLYRRETQATAAPPEQSEPDMELLSNEEQVLALLESNDGRMKQQAIVQELGWTDAKTSQVVSELREAGEVESFRLGRENVLRLPEPDEDGH